MKAIDRLFVALDVDSLGKADVLVSELKGVVRNFKVGLELISAEGYEVINKLQRYWVNIFADVKYHDIPTTVGKASQALVRHKPAMFNVHASGGIAMIKAAAENKGCSKLVAVTILTSHDNDETVDIYGGAPIEKVLQFAKFGLEGGADIILCSPHEIALLRKESEFSGMELMTPGVRPAGYAADDQKRIMTPGEAIHAGASYLVVGRPILDQPTAALRREAAEKILDEMDQAASAVPSSEI